MGGPLRQFEYYDPANHVEFSSALQRYDAQGCFGCKHRPDLDAEPVRNDRGLHVCKDGRVIRLRRYCQGFE